MSGKTVLVPLEQPASLLVPLNMDSTLASDRKLWLMGSTGTLAAGDSTAVRNLTFRIDAPATKGQFKFAGVGEEIVDWPVLSGLPLLDTTKIVTVPGDTTRLFRVNVWLIFKGGVTDSAKTAFLNQFGMSVIGVSTTGTFYVTIQDPTSAATLYQVTDSIRAHSAIKTAGVLVRSSWQITNDARYPSDGAGMTRID